MKNNKKKSLLVGAAACTVLAGVGASTFGALGGFTSGTTTGGSKAKPVVVSFSQQLTALDEGNVTTDTWTPIDVSSAMEVRSAAGQPANYPATGAFSILPSAINYDEDLDRRAELTVKNKGNVTGVATIKVANFAEAEYDSINDQVIFAQEPFSQGVAGIDFVTDVDSDGLFDAGDTAYYDWNENGVYDLGYDSLIDVDSSRTRAGELVNVVFQVDNNADGDYADAGETLYSGTLNGFVADANAGNLSFSLPKALGAETGIRTIRMTSDIRAVANDDADMGTAVEVFDLNITLA